MHTTINIPTSSASLPVIRLMRFRHRGKRQVGLLFSYNAILKKHLLAFPRMRWTRTYSCFYLADDPVILARLIEHCHGSAWIELGDLRNSTARSSTNGAPKGKLRKPKATFDPEIKEKLAVYHRWLEQKRYRPSTIKTYLSFVRQFFAQNRKIAWNGLTAEIINAYNHSEFITKGKSYSAQNQWINAVKLYLRVHGLNVGSLEDIERPRRGQRLPDVLSKEEVKSILKVVRNLKHRTLLMLIYSSGLRIGEALDLKVKDISSKESLIYIRSAKGNKDRRVPLSPVMLKQLRKYYVAYTPSDYLFVGQGGGRYSSKSASNILKRAVAQVGIKKRVTLHTLRHSYATHVTQRGVSLRYVQDILGHKSPKTTMIYTHLSGEDIRGVKSPLDDLGL